MSFSDLKLYVISSLGLAVSLTDVNELLQFFVLLGAAIPAATRGYSYIKNKISKNEDNK